ncbi:hypothetical protein TREMEDRAFT_62283 [Tremella mesenterica DSM 1558]|uniref:uncharacterized protein n=1 Tax=Tremella mesenterica (strain ATCC 24925 / CBS 8224 / DSM 1558 / NBRC 9311 / NRRL Y-6157 / RJB 2259-6 / UBC 559-6) TaxID=578456 RepID=UPI0003F48F51|nr:uncharacterized protein TREMEDRAFT_62283 [Tremella mesenterica DSM 1558]EIW69417.1 hypothetical protein TREMEDRAFT_62283 [Tremella mesenterica DSM 1558]
MRFVSFVFLSIFITLSTVSASSTSEITDLTTKSLTNSERFKRGLPPNVPMRRYNATTTRNHLARRSAQTTPVYLRATPLAPPISNRRTVKVSEMERDDTPVTGISWVQFDSSIYRFILHVHFRYIHTDGTNQQVTFFPEDGTTSYICAATASSTYGSMDTSPFTAVVFGACGSQTLDEAYGAYQQVPIWTTPATFPASAGITYHNADHGDTLNPSFWIFSNGFANY